MGACVQLVGLNISLGPTVHAKFLGQKSRPRWIIILVETPSLGLTNNLTFQYVWHFINIDFVEYRQNIVINFIPGLST